jgi:hypothetical protein
MRSFAKGATSLSSQEGNLSDTHECPALQEARHGHSRRRALQEVGMEQMWPLREGRLHSVGERSLVMAILNTTPDSFSDGGTHLDAYAPSLKALVKPFIFWYQRTC